MTVTISIITSSSIQHYCVYHHDYVPLAVSSMTVTPFMITYHYSIVSMTVTIIMVTGTSLEYVGDSHHDYVRTYTSIVYV